MAKAAGVSHRSVQRIWAAHGLKPHRVRSFKLSNDPRFAAKVQDVVGLYIDPPEHELVLSVDEFYRVAFRKKMYRTIDELQADLDAWLVEYNERRSHQGRWCFGKTPMQTFLDAIDILKSNGLLHPV